MLVLMAPLNALRVSRAAPIDRADFRAESSFQNRPDLGAAQRRRAPAWATKRVAPLFCGRMRSSQRSKRSEETTMTDTNAARDRVALLRGLRAVRQFLPDPVPQHIVDDLLEVARWTGSSRNLQPWECIVVRRRETLQALAAAEGYVKHLAGAALAIVLVMAGESFEDETYDEGRLSERIMLAAAAHGVGSCIGWFAGGGRADARAILGVPEPRLVRTAISLGYPDEAARRARPKPEQPRKPLAALVHDERYS
jgi:nitroreductase